MPPTDELQKWIRPLHDGLSRLLGEELGRTRKPDNELSEAEIARFGDMLLRDAVREEVSDIHLEPQEGLVRVRFRINGVLQDTAVLSREQGRRLTRHFKTLAELDPVRTFAPQAARRSVDVDGERIDLRLATAPCIHGEKLAIRLLDQRRLKQALRELGLSREAHEKVRQWLSPMSGMFLVCGPTGSGKTTTLYALLHELKLAERSVVTIEDPVEYAIDGVTQMQVDLRHGLNFTEGLKAMLRLDPDYLLLGEIRGPESARAAAEAAISGRGLMSTLHARDAVSVVTALRNWNLANHEIAATLEVVVSQRLVRTLCETCRRETRVDRETSAWFEALEVEAPRKIFTAQGCDACKGLGYAGRTGVFEVWRLDSDDLQGIADGVDEYRLRRCLLDRGHTFLIHDALEKLRSGVTSVEEVRRLPGLAIDTRRPSARRRRRTRRTADGEPSQAA